MQGGGERVGRSSRGGGRALKSLKLEAVWFSFYKINKNLINEALTNQLFTCSVL